MSILGLRALLTFEQIKIFMKERKEGQTKIRIFNDPFKVLTDKLYAAN